MTPIRNNISLARHAHYRIGGRARYFAEVSNVRESMSVIRWALRDTVPFFFMGAGTNVLFSDQGFKGLVIKNNYSVIRKRPNGIFFSSGVLMSEAVSYFIRNGLQGLEWAGGLPGTVGGAVFGNAGCFGDEIEKHILAVESLVVDRNRKTVTKHTRSHRACKFSYRTSIFKQSGDEIITGVILRATPGSVQPLAAKAQECIDYRTRFQPLEYPSAGSTFKNISLASVSAEVAALFSQVVKTDPFPVIPVAAVLDKLSLKGYRIGGAEISEKHPNFFINRNKATACDIIALIDLARQKARKQYGIELDPEIRILS